jgi:hypothetical protein
LQGKSPRADRSGVQKEVTHFSGSRNRFRPAGNGGFRDRQAIHSPAWHFHPVAISATEVKLRRGFFLPPGSRTEAAAVAIAFDFPSPGLYFFPKKKIFSLKNLN